jgi:hypothetical protein
MSDMFNSVKMNVTSYFIRDRRQVQNYQYYIVLFTGNGLLLFLLELDERFDLIFVPLKIDFLGHNLPVEWIAHF